MASVSGLLSDAERIAELSDSLSDWFAGELADVLRRLERRLRDWADGERNVTVEAARLALVRSEIRDLLQTAGFDTLVAAASVKGLDRLATQVLSTSTAQRVASVPQSLSQQIAGLQAFLGMDLLDQGDVIARDLWRAVMRGVIAGEDHEALVADLAETLDRSVASVRTLYDTSVSIYARQVEALNATGEPDEAFAYLGPVDTAIRPFCFDHVGKVYTRAQIDRMDNGQLPNVFMTGGGYNCRHQFVAVSQFSEVRDLLGKGERMPEVAQRVKDVRKERKAA